MESVTGNPYLHVVARRPGIDRSPLVHVYIEGDGVPWYMGIYPSRDPTPENALALRLATRDDHDVIYIGRPCYFGRRGDANCDSSLWTSGRYGPDVVDSMAAVIRAATRGGVLATLIADRLAETRAVLTVAANLDIDAWTEYHGYEPLSGSINPAVEARRTQGVDYLQLTGGKDRNVPEPVSRAYRERHPETRTWSYPEFDHDCCWEAEWPSIVSRFYTFLAAREQDQLID